MIYFITYSVNDFMNAQASITIVYNHNYTCQLHDLQGEKYSQKALLYRKIYIKLTRIVSHDYYLIWYFLYV